MKRMHSTISVVELEHERKRAKSGFPAWPPTPPWHSTGLSARVHRTVPEIDITWCPPTVPRLPPSLPAHSGSEMLRTFGRVPRGLETQIATLKSRIIDNNKTVCWGSVVPVHHPQVWTADNQRETYVEELHTLILEQSMQAHKATEEKYRNEIALLNQTHRDALAALEEKHRDALAKAEKKNAAIITAKDASHCKALSDAKEEHRATRLKAEQESAATIAEWDAAHCKALSNATEKHRATQLEVETARVECADLRKANAQLQSDYAASQTAEAHLRSEHARVLAENAKLYGQNTTFRLQRLVQGGSAVEDVTKVEDEA